MVKGQSIIYLSMQFILRVEKFNRQDHMDENVHSEKLDEILKDSKPPKAMGSFHVMWVTQSCHKRSVTRQLNRERGSYDSKGHSLSQIAEAVYSPTCAVVSKSP